MILKNRKGFTLIEILIVVAIIAILASVVLVGLAPTQQAGRDARRVSDLSEVQNGLELYYNHFGLYPGTVTGAAGSPSSSGWPGFATTLVNSNVGVSSVSSDPSNGRQYTYWYASAANVSYVLGAALENGSSSVFNNYTPPSLTGQTQITGGSGTFPANCTAPNYCITL